MKLDFYRINDRILWSNLTSKALIGDRMKLSKSGFAQKWFGIVAGAVIGLLLSYGLSPVLAQVSLHHKTTQAKQPKKDYNPELAVVNLPAGERFVAYGPVINGFQTYITEKRTTNEGPRRLTIFRPSMITNRGWEVFIYIQEN